MPKKGGSDSKVWKPQDNSLYTTLKFFSVDVKAWPHWYVTALKFFFTPKHYRAFTVRCYSYTLNHRFEVFLSCCCLSDQKSLQILQRKKMWSYLLSLHSVLKTKMIISYPEYPLKWILVWSKMRSVYFLFWHSLCEQNIKTKVQTGAKEKLLLFICIVWREIG